MYNPENFLEQKDYQEIENPKFLILEIVEEYLKEYNRIAKKPRFARGILIYKLPKNIFKSLMDYPEIEEFLKLNWRKDKKNNLEGINNEIFEGLPPSKSGYLKRKILKKIRIHLLSFYNILFKDYDSISNLFKFYGLDYKKRASVLLELGDEIISRYKEILNLFFEITQKNGKVLNWQEIEKIINMVDLMPLLTDRQRIEFILENTGFPLEIVIKIAKYLSGRKKDIDEIICIYNDIKKRYPYLYEKSKAILVNVSVNSYYKKISLLKNQISIPK